ncbi:MAG TPA: methyltransferase [Gemmatimonadaceae bacterium]|nr:methyltransferase [Gemmatimonadaceae bacterium]
MPLRPNFVERRLIARGTIPWPLLDVFLAAQQAAVVSAAAELGLFDVLRGGALTAEEVAARTGASLPGTIALLTALTGLGYVAEGAEGRVYLTPAARRAMPLDDIRTIAPFLLELVRVAGESAHAVREAPPGGVVDHSRIQSGSMGRAFQTAMRWTAAGNMREVGQRVELPDSARRLLDVGGSHGLYTVALCTKYPELHATILDWPIGIEAARQTMHDHPDIAPRVDFAEGDFERDVELPGGYDVAFLGNIVHGLTPEQNATLLAKIARATTDSATVVILDQLAGKSGSAFSRGVAGLIGFNLFLVTGGRAYRFDEMREWLAAAGFPHATHTALRKAPGLSLVTARK